MPVFKLCHKTRNHSITISINIGAGVGAEVPEFLLLLQSLGDFGLW